MAAAFASNEVTYENVSADVTVPNYDVCRLSYYLNCVTKGCDIDILADDLIDYQNAHRLPASRSDAVFKLAATDLKASEVIGNLIFLDDDHEILPSGTSNMFIKVTNVSNILAVQSSIIIAGNASKVTQVMFFDSGWLESYYEGPLKRNQVRVLRALGGGAMARLLTQMESITIEEVDSDHCDHCKGLDGKCACKHGCKPQSDTKCSVMHHCDHCKGSEGACACNYGCAQSAHGKCRVVHISVTCDGCTKSQIHGVRYKCAECSDYDLCQTCYQGGKLHRIHAFKKIARVGSTPVLLNPRMSEEDMQARLEQMLASRKSKAATAPVAREPTPTPSARNGAKFVGDGMSIQQMKAYLRSNGVASAGAAEKQDLRRLVWETQIEMLGTTELNEFMDAQNISRSAGSSMSVRRRAAIAAFPAERTPPAPTGIRRFCKGQTVKLTGLRRTDMNGVLGTVMSNELVGGRVRVQPLNGGSVVSQIYELKPENLVMQSQFLD